MPGRGAGGVVAVGSGAAHWAEAKPGHKNKGLEEQKCVCEKEKDRDRIKAETAREAERQTGTGGA